MHELSGGAWSKRKVYCVVLELESKRAPVMRTGSSWVMDVFVLDS